MLVSSISLSLYARPQRANMDSNSGYRGLHVAVKPAVIAYKDHTAVVQRFLVDHGLRAIGWECWDVAPFHVLNVRKGRAVPQEILQALDAAIEGRESVSDRFTEANSRPQILMDASDITHRVFVEKLRTLRRVWFPDVLEKVGDSSAASGTNAISSRLKIVQPTFNDPDPVAVGRFTALSGISVGSDFYKVSFGWSPFLREAYGD
jgi:hypothetical protein